MIATADQIEALGATIFDPRTATGLQAPDASVDAHLAALLAEPMLTIDGRALALGFRYTLNITNALQLRPKHWYLTVDEMEPGTAWAATANLEYFSGQSLAGFASSPGMALGLATCAAICRAWAAIIRMWLAGNYPLAVTPPPAP